LERELEGEILEAKTRAREDLMSNFDQSVVEKVKIGAQATLDTVTRKLWRLTRHMLESHATFDDERHEFHLPTPVIDETLTPSGRYVFRRGVQDAGYVYRIGHPLALHVINRALEETTPEAEVVFAVSTHASVLAALRPLVGKSGWLEVTHIANTFKDGQREEHVIVAAECDDGTTIEPEVAHQFFECSGRVTGSKVPKQSPSTQQRLNTDLAREKTRLETKLKQRTQKLLQEEMTKLEAWEEDQQAQVRAAFEDLQAKLKELNRTITLCNDLAESLELEEQKLRLRSSMDREEARVRGQLIDVGERKLNILKKRKGLLESESTANLQFRIRWQAA
jgi:gas vesicle protein